MKNWEKIFLGLLVVFIVLQFIPVDRSTPEVVESQDFIVTTQPSAEIGTLIKNSCYDCHSYQTKYPWYASIAPVSWWLQDHVNEGREHLNFSTWAINPKKAKMLEECAEEVLEGKMPMDSYTWIHSEARLTNTQRKQLATWFEQNGGGATGKTYSGEEEE